jgi:acyl-CoA synthetase (NDP forming)
MTTKNWQKAFWRPDRIALIGVSDNPEKTTGRPLKFLRAAGYGGEIYAVNPTRDTVQSEKAYCSLLDLPLVPDHVFILTGAARALDA